MSLSERHLLNAAIGVLHSCDTRTLRVSPDDYLLSARALYELVRRERKSMPAPESLGHAHTLREVMENVYFELFGRLPDFLGDQGPTRAAGIGEALIARLQASARRRARL